MADQTFSKELAKFTSDSQYHCKQQCEDNIVREQEIYQIGAEKGDTNALNMLT